jgi:hypothetical protein
MSICMAFVFYFNFFFLGCVLYPKHASSIFGLITYLDDNLVIWVNLLNFENSITLGGYVVNHVYNNIKQPNK